jgi:hypothetical protein
MRTQPYPTTTSKPTTSKPTTSPPPALHLLHGVWVASCPTCGFQLTSARSQARCERRAARKTCPVCREDA